MSNKFSDLGFEPVETVDSFDTAFQRTLGFEGGNTVDHAGATNLGVTQDTYNNWRKRQGLPTKSVRDIDQEEAKQLYKQEYFDKPGFSKLPPNIAGVLFDYGVNAGTPRAAMALQKAVGASPDGVIGPKTLKAVDDFVNRKGEAPLLQSIVDQRSKHVDSLIQKNPAKYKKYEKGWKNRINAIKGEFKLSDLNPLAVSEASASEIPQGDFTDLGFEEASTIPEVKPTESFTDLGFEPSKPQAKESLGETVNSIAGGLWRGMGNIPIGVSGVGKAILELTGDKASAEHLQRWRDNQKANLDYVFPTSKDTTDFGKHPIKTGLRAASESAPMMMLSFGSAASKAIPEFQKIATAANLTKVQKAVKIAEAMKVISAKEGLKGAALFAPQAFSDTYDAARSHDVSPKLSATLGLTNAVGQVVLESKAFDFMLRGTGTGNIAYDIFMGAFVEGVMEEGTQGVLQNALTFTYDKPKEFQKGFSRLMQGVPEGIFAGSLMGGVAGGAMSKTRTQIQKEQDAMATKEVALKIMENNAKQIGDPKLAELGKIVVEKMSDAALTVDLSDDTANGKVLDEKDVPDQAPAPSKEILAEAQKPATPIERASQHGEVVGIDAKSGLPVIDTSVKPVIRSEEDLPTPEQLAEDNATSHKAAIASATKLRDEAIQAGNQDKADKAQALIEKLSNRATSPTDNIKQIIEQAGGKFKSLTDQSNSVYENEPTIYYDTPSGSTQTIRPSQLTAENVKAKIDKFENSKPVEAAQTTTPNPMPKQTVDLATAGKPTNNLKEYVDSLPIGPINITRDEIYSKFDNDLKPIAEIPQKYVKYLSASSNEVFSGKAYFIDHHINHHPTTTREDYLTIPEVLKSPDEVKQNLKEGKKGLVFIKKFDKYHAAVVSLDVENGKIILHKTFFTQTKKPYKKSPLVELEGEGGNSSISQAVKPPAESVSARPSDKNIPQNKNIVKPKGDPASLKPPTVSQKEAGSTLEKVEQEIISSAIDPTKAPEKRLSAGMSIQGIPKGKTKLSPSLKVDVNDKLNGDFKFSDPETELRYKNAQGVFSGNKIKTRIHEMFSEFAKRSTRTYPELENDPKYSSFKVLLDKHRIGKQVAQDRAIRIIDGITAGFGPVKKDIFTRKVLLDDLINEAKSGRAVPFGYSNYDESGNLVINNEALNKDYSNINKVVENNPDIKAAVEKRNKIQNAIAQELVDAGILSEEQLKNNYYRHQVLDYANIKATFGGGKTLKTPKPGYAKGRKGSTYDINTNYVEAEFEFMAQALNDIETVKTIQQIEKSPLNISKKVRADFNAAKESDPSVKLEDFIPEGYSVWQPVKGNVFYTAYSVPERVISQMMTDQGVGGLSANDVHKILAIGGKKKQLILPDGVVKTLDNLYEVKNDNVIVKGATFLTNKWKGYILVNPRRFFKYNLQNFIGDFDAVIAGDPRILKKLGEANSELVDVFYNGKEMSPDLREYFERGGISSQLTVSELPELNELEIFKRLSSQQFSAKNLNIWEKYWESVGKFTTYREAILRYAAYKHYKELYSKGEPKTFGASKKEDILALNDPKDQAAKVATELLGDYANITAFGKDMRQTLAPFWSWYEVNLKRYARLTRNAFDEGFDKGIKTSATIAGLKGSAFLMKWLLRAMLLTGAASLYNHLFHSDIEDDLSQYDRNRMHITIGKTKDGQNVIFRTQGAFADVLEWLGLDGAPTLTKQYFDGKASLGDIFGTIPYTDIPAMGLNPASGEIGLHAAANKVLRAIGPLYKVPTETLTGYSWGGFDDKAHKIEDKKRNIAMLVSLENEYDAIVGNPTRGYFRSLAEAFVAISDPEENAYRYIQSLKYQYKEAVLGQGGSGDYYSPRSILYRKYKKALRFKDDKVADKVFAQMNELGVKEEDLKKSLNASDPLFGLNKENKKHFTETYLSDADREKLKRANAYYEKTFKQTMSKEDKENELKIQKWLQSK